MVLAGCRRIIPAANWSVTGRLPEDNPAGYRWKLRANHISFYLSVTDEALKKQEMIIFT